MLRVLYFLFVHSTLPTDGDPIRAKMLYLLIISNGFVIKAETLSLRAPKAHLLAESGPMHVLRLLTHHTDVGGLLAALHGLPAAVVEPRGLDAGGRLDRLTALPGAVTDGPAVRPAVL